jgi:hypothetical protein
VCNPYERNIKNICRAILQILYKGHDLSDEVFLVLKEDGYNINYLSF